MSVATIADVLAQRSRDQPAAVAIVDTRNGRERRLTFEGLAEEVAKATAWLQAQGLRKGDGVLVFVPMSADLYVALLAMFRLGVVALFLDPASGRGHLEQCCARWRPRAMLAIPKAHLLRITSRALRAIPLKIAIHGWAPGARTWLQPSTAMTAQRADASPNGAVAPDDPALVTFTSGSTGVPKAAVRTHRFLLAQHRVLAPNIALVAGEVDLATLPIFTLANLASGLTTIIPDVDLRRPGEIDAARVFAQVTRFGVTRITASPAFFERLIAHGRAARQTLPMLRKLYTGGAPVFPRLLDALHALAPQAQVVAVYGSTEAEPIAHCAYEEIGTEDLVAMQAGRGLLAGHVVSDVALRIVRDQWGTPRTDISAEAFRDEALPIGEIGEIVVAGDHVLTGYLGGLGDAETKFRVDGQVWHRTGDAGLLDERGRLWLFGRCAARIDDHHGRLYPFAVECVAMTLPFVQRTAVIAHAGERWLIVESHGYRDVLERQLLAATAWAHVARIRFVDRMPVDARHNAKIDYPALRRKFGIEQAER